MHNIIAIQGLISVNNLLEVLDSFGFREKFFLLDKLIESPIFTQLVNKVVISLGPK